MSYTNITDLTYLQDQPDARYFTEIGELLLEIYACILLLLGIPGNVISAIIMGSDSTSRITTRALIIILSVADTAVLMTAVLRYWLVHLWDWDPRKSGPISCKTHVFAVAFSTDFAVGALCAVAVERFLVVAFPHKANRTVTIQSILIGMTCFGLGVTVKNLLHFWMMGSDTSTSMSGNSNDTKQMPFVCRPAKEYEYMFRIFMKVDFISFAVLPYIILFSSNVFIYVKLRKQRQIMKKHVKPALPTPQVTDSSTHNTNMRTFGRLSSTFSGDHKTCLLGHNNMRSLTENPTSKRQQRRPESVIKLLTALTIIHVICTLPGTIFTLLSSYFNYFQTMDKQTHNLIKSSLVMLIFTNNASNFFGYYASCTMFRKKFKGGFQTLFRICYPKHSRPDEPGNSSNQKITTARRVDFADPHIMFDSPSLARPLTNTDATRIQTDTNLNLDYKNNMSSTKECSLSTTNEL